MNVYYEEYCGDGKHGFTCRVDPCRAETLTLAGMHLHLAVWHGIRLASPPSDAPLGSDLPRTHREEK